MMNNGLIETYHTKENGYHPFFIREHWQVAQLNYLPYLSFKGSICISIQMKYLC